MSNRKSVEEHQQAVAGLLAPTETVTLPLADCLGLVLARDLVTGVSLPPFDNSAMDGYAVRAFDVADADADEPARLPVAADIPAGRTDPVTLLPGTAARIMTGAPVPDGADAIVPVEGTDAGTGTVAVHEHVRPGTHVRRSGEDVRAGSTVLAAGTELSAAALGLAAAVGSGSLEVFRRAGVLVLSTGSELVAPGEPLRAGQIYESNGTMLAAAVEEAGGKAELLRFVPDDVDTFLATLDARLAGVDLVVTSGGVSAGAYEVVKDALADRGVQFYPVAMQPGGPQGAGRYRGVPVVTFPGNPVSSLVSFEVFVRPALRTAMGHAERHRAPIAARLAEDVRSVAGKRQYLRGRYEAASGEVRTHGGPGSHLLGSLATANCLLAIPEAETDLPAGTEVELLPLGATGT